MTPRKPAAPRKVWLIELVDPFTGEIDRSPETRPFRRWLNLMVKLALRVSRKHALANPKPRKRGKR